MFNFNIQVIEQPSRRSLHVNVRPDTSTITIKDKATSLGLDRSEALALGRALIQSVEALDRAAPVPPNA